MHYILDCIIYWQMNKRRLAVLGVGNETGTSSPSGHLCDSQQTNCGLNWWCRSTSLLLDVQIIKVTTVTGTTLHPGQRIQISFLVTYWKAAESRSSKSWVEAHGEGTPRTAARAVSVLCAHKRFLFPQLSNQH